MINDTGGLPLTEDERREVNELRERALKIETLACYRAQREERTAPCFSGETGQQSAAGLAIEMVKAKSRAKPCETHPPRFRRPSEVLGIQTESNERHSIAKGAIGDAMRMMEKEHPSLPLVRARLSAALELLR